MKQRLLILILFLINNSLSAQSIDDGAIILDRPDLTESPFVVPKGYLQFENGFMYESNENERTLTSPTSLIKYGVNSNFELRLIATYETSLTNSNIKLKSGIIPIWVGLKSCLFEEKGIIPKTSIIAHLQISKWASKEMQLEYIHPQFRFAMQNTLSKNISLSYNLGMEWDGITPDSKFIYSVSSSISMSKRLGCYFELYGDYARANAFVHNADGGFTYLLNNNSILDLSAGLNLNNKSKYCFISTGYSFRFSLKKDKQKEF
jgi:hypothetical protein